MIEYYFAIIVFSIIVSFTLSHFIIPRLKRFGIIGKDVNKEGRPEVAEMGGIAVVAGFSAGVLLAVFFNTFFGFEFNLIFVLAGLITIHSISFIGIIDDLLDIPQWLKAILPLFAAVPLIAVKAASSTVINIPFLGVIDLGLFYILVLIPIGVAVASNLTNMFAGFNGMETGMGIVIFSFISIIAFFVGGVESLLIFLPMLGALIGFLYFNKFPAKAFPGDIGNLTIGAVLATGVIIGNLETFGALLLIPYVVDFFIKAYNRFPSSKWWGEIREGKLYSPEKPIGFAQHIMKITKGVEEKKLTLIFIGIEVLVGILVLGLFFIV